jgi:hypothetical protein
VDHWPTFEALKNFGQSVFAGSFTSLMLPELVQSSLTIA